MKIKYIGCYDAVDIPALNIGNLAKNEIVDIDSPIAEELLKQKDNWAIADNKTIAVEAPAKKGE